jgi:predicted adenine nucleotide alpha hydrolase (AANH) superfamily ATPase
MGYLGRRVLSLEPMRRTRERLRDRHEAKPAAYDERDVRGKRILLHACCAPDATAVLELWLPLAESITVFFFNPNVHPDEEYAHRLEAMQAVANHFGVKMLSSRTESDCAECDAALFPLGEEPEGGKRCCECFEFRLRATSHKAQELDMDAFATTLTISPHKSHGLINALGMSAAAECGVDYIATNFKKGEGFKRSVELSRHLGVYRQDYCGCRWSAR